MLVTQQNATYDFEEIIQQLNNIENQPAWQLLYANNADGTEFPINKYSGNKENLIKAINQGHSLKSLIRFIGENQLLSLLPQTFWVEEIPKNYPNEFNHSTVIAQYLSICDKSFFPKSLRIFSDSYCQILI